MVMEIPKEIEPIIFDQLNKMIGPHKGSISPRAAIFLLGSGASASYFMEHARYIGKEFPGHIEFNNSSMTLTYNLKMMKLYVHHNKRSREYLTVKRKGVELGTFHYTESAKKVFDFIMGQW